MLAAFFNAQGSLWYELLGGWVGKGDKETFAYAFAATHTPFSVVETPVDSIGILGQVPFRVCEQAAWGGFEAEDICSLTFPSSVTLLLLELVSAIEVFDLQSHHGAALAYAAQVSHSSASPTDTACCRRCSIKALRHHKAAD